MNKNKVVKIDDLALTLSPVSVECKEFALKTLMQNYIVGSGLTRDPETSFLSLSALVREALKHVEGSLINVSTGFPFELDFADEDHKFLTDRCTTDFIVSTTRIFGQDFLQKLCFVIYSELHNQNIFEFTDQKGEPLSGVDILPDPNSFQN